MSRPHELSPPPWPLALLPMLVGAASRGLWAPDEPRYAEVAREMATTGAWLVPQLCGAPYPDKPPGLFWLLAGLGTVSDFHPLILRLPSLGAMALIAWLIGDLARRATGSAAMVRLAPLLWLTMALPTAIGGRLQLDPTLTACTTAGLWAFAALPPRRAAWLAGVAAGAGALVKGPVAWLWVGGVGVAWWLHAGRPRLRGFDLVIGGTAAVAPVAVWALLAIRAAPELAADLAFDQHAGRIFAARSHPGPPWEPLVELALLTLPWMPFAALGLADVRRDPGRGFDRLLALWVLVPLAAFSVIAEKRNLYLLPAYPAVALLAAAALTRRSALRGPLRRFSIAIAAALVLGGAALALLPLAAPRLAAAGLDVEDLAWRAPLAALPPVLLAAMALSAAWRGAIGAFTTRLATAWIALATAAALVVFPALDPRKCAADVAHELAAGLGRPPTIVCIDVQPEAFRFYADLPTVADAGYGDQLADALRRDGPRCVALATARGIAGLPASLRAAFAVAGSYRVGGREILVLRPRPPLVPPAVPR